MNSKSKWLLKRVRNESYVGGKVHTNIKIRTLTPVLQLAQYLQNKALTRNKPK